MAKMSFKNSLKKETSLVEMFNEINTDIMEVLETDHYLTAFAGVYDRSTRLLKYAKAGHVAQLLFTQGGKSFL